MCAGKAKGDIAMQNDDRVLKAPESEKITLAVTGRINVATTRGLILLPLPQQIPGMPPAVPVLAPLCWDCVTGLRVLKSNLAIMGSGLAPT